MREQEILQSHTSKFFRETEVWIEVINLSDNSKSDIWCINMGGELLYLNVDGKEIELEGSEH